MNNCLSHAVRAAVLMGALVLVTGCSGNPAVPAAPSDTAAVEAEANRVFVQIYGNAEQREAGNYLEWLALNKSYWACMAEHGVEPVRHFSQIWTGWTPNATSGEWMGALQLKPSIHALGIAASAGEEFEKSEQSVDYQKVSDGCQADDSSMTVGGGPGTPEGAAELVGDFKTLIRSVDSRLGSIDEYTQCMSEAGVDYPAKADGDRGWQGLYMFLTASMPKPPLSGQEPSEAWQKYLELETKALDADEQCRGAKYEQGLVLLAPELDAFVGEHRGELDTVAAGWGTIVEKARAEGFAD